MRSFHPIGFLILCLLAGCSSSQGLHVESLQAILQQEASRFEGDRSEGLTPARNVQPAAPTLGLYLKPTGFVQHEFEWTGRDQNHLLTWVGGMVADRILARASFVPQSSLKGDNLARLRESAARYGADLLLVLDGAAAVDRYNNYKAPLLYWTILGAYLADGTHSDALCLVRGFAWDVKSGSLLFHEEAQGNSRQVGPAAFLDDKVAIDEAKRAALEQLERLIAERFKRFGSSSSAEGEGLNENRNSRARRRTTDSATESAR